MKILSSVYMINIKTKELLRVQVTIFEHKVVVRTISNGGRKPQEEISIGVIENSYKSDTKASLSSGYCSWARVPRIKIDRIPYYFSRLILQPRSLARIYTSVGRVSRFLSARFSLNESCYQWRKTIACHLSAEKLEILNDVIIIFTIQLKRSSFFFLFFFFKHDCVRWLLQ